MKSCILGLGLLAATAAPAAAQESDRDAFVRDNLIATVYHEFGHALVYRLDLPIFGQEEDAADVASVLLMERLHDEGRAAQLVISAADGFAAEEMALERDGLDVAFDGLHGPDAQRYYNTICLYYGGDPDARGDMIDVMGLSEYRAETCEEEYEAAQHSWGFVFDEITAEGEDDSILLDLGEADAPITQAAMTEIVDAMNAAFALDDTLPILIEPCDEPNAFFEPDRDLIVMCTEYEAYLGELFDLLNG